MSGWLRSTVPTTQSQRLPKVPNAVCLREKEEQLKMRQKENFDTHHGFRTSPEIAPGDRVWVPDQETEGSVQDEVMPRSCTYKSPPETEHIIGTGDI